MWCNMLNEALVTSRLLQMLLLELFFYVSQIALMFCLESTRFTLMLSYDEVDVCSQLIGWNLVWLFLLCFWLLALWFNLVLCVMFWDVCVDVHWKVVTVDHNQCEIGDEDIIVQTMTTWWMRVMFWCFPRVLSFGCCLNENSLSDSWTWYSLSNCVHEPDNFGCMQMDIKNNLFDQLITSAAYAYMASLGVVHRCHLF